MKILQVTPRYPPQSGGVETHVQQISERLVDRGHEVTVLTADAGQEGAHRERRNGVRIRRYRSIAPAGTIHFCPQITAAVRNADVDVVHAHNYHSFPLVFAALGVGDRRFVVTTHYHGESASLIRDILLSLYRPIGQWAVRHADEVIAVSKWERGQLAADLQVDATVIPNGLDNERFVEAEPVERDRPYLLTVGRLEEYKGVQHSIRAMTNLLEYDLLIAGSGPFRDQLEQIARTEGVDDHVKFLGYVDDKKLSRLYAGAEVYVTMSEFEAYGMTVSEALAAGTPCVVREAAALVDWIDRADCLGVTSIQPLAIAQTVRKLTTQNAPTSGLPTWDDVVDRVLTCYE